MAKFSLCIEPLFENVSFYDRIRLAKDCGADAIEFWDPAAYDVKKIASAAAKASMPVAGCTLFNPWQLRMNLDTKTVTENVKKSIALGKEMGCSTFIGLSGDVEGKADSQKNILIENLKRVADIVVKENVTIVLEALNSLVDHKGYYLDSSYVGFEIIKAVACPNIRLLYDIYHMQIMEGNVIDNVTRNINSIGHFHSAGVPGRHEHFSGESDYKNIIAAIEKAGYDRYIGLEYWPTYDNSQSVKDVFKYLKG